MSEISTVIFTYLRPDYFREQIEAIKNQTIFPKEIIVGHLVNDKTKDFDFSLVDKVIKFEFDPGFQAKFITALASQGKWLLILDDDTIPGKRWIENCLDCFKKKPGIYTPFGVRITNPSYRGVYRLSGWDHNNEEIEEVDMAGHSWFFPFSYLHYMFMEHPLFYENAEDLWFSAQCQKHGNIEVYVPPHPEDDKEMWGSLKPEYGLDKKAISIRAYKEHNSLRDKMVAYLINEREWKPLFMRDGK